MDFQLTNAQSELRDAARKFARAEMPDVAAYCEETGHPVKPDMLKKLGEMGFLGINIPEQSRRVGAG